MREVLHYSLHQPMKFKSRPTTQSDFYSLDNNCYQIRKHSLRISVNREIQFT